MNERPTPFATRLSGRPRSSSKRRALSVAIAVSVLPKVRPADGVENRHGIVDAGVDIDDHSARAAHVEGILTRAQSSGLERASADLWHRRCHSNGSDLKRNMLAESQATARP